MMRAAGLLLLLLALPLHAGQRPPWEDKAYIEKAFIEIAFKREYSAGLKRLNKWMRPIHWQIDYEGGIKPSKTLETPILRHLDQLESITGIVMVPVTRQPSLHIVLTRDRDFAAAIVRHGIMSSEEQARAFVRGVNCMGHFRTNRRGEITSAWVLIPVDHAFKRGIYPACVVEELTQVMGLPNDADWVNPSIANDSTRQDLLSPLDYVMLRLLYQPELKPGMTVEQARPVIRRLLNRFERLGILRMAPWLVKQAGLNKLSAEGRL